MRADEIHVEEILLRLPGIDPREAQRLGTEIAARVAQALLEKRPGASIRALGGIDVRLEPVARESRAALVERGVAAIVAGVLR
jgi:hypothetical protein